MSIPTLRTCHLEASEDIMAKFKSQFLPIISLKYWNASGSGSPHSNSLEHRHQAFYFMNRPNCAYICNTVRRGVICHFLFRWISIVVNPPKRRLAKHISVQCTASYITDFLIDFKKSVAISTLDDATFFSLVPIARSRTRQFFLRCLYVYLIDPIFGC